MANIHDELLQACWDCRNTSSYFMKLFFRTLWQMAQYLKLRQKPLIYFSVAINWALAFGVFLCKKDIAALNSLQFDIIGNKQSFIYTTHLYMVLLFFATKSVCSAQERMVGKYHDDFFVQVKQVYCYRILRRLRVPPAAAPLILSFSSGFYLVYQNKKTLERPLSPTADDQVNRTAEC